MQKLNVKKINISTVNKIGVTFKKGTGICFVLSVVVCNAETWTLRRTEEKYLECLKRECGKPSVALHLYLILA